MLCLFFIETTFLREMRRTYLSLYFSRRGDTRRSLVRQSCHKNLLIMTSSTSLSFSCVIKPRSSKWRMHFYIGVDSNLLLASFFLFVLRARAVVGSEQWWARRPFFFGIIKRFYEQLAVLFAPRASHKIPVSRLVSSLVLISRSWFINSHLESRGCVCLLYPSSILSRRMFTSPFTYTGNRGSSPCVVSARRSAQYHNASSKRVSA